MYNVAIRLGSTFPRCFRNMHHSLLFAAVLLSTCTVALAQKSVSGGDFVVSKPVIDMFTHATSDSSVTSQALYGTGVLSLERQGEWVKIRTADAYTGWVSAAGLHSESSSPYAPEAEAVRVTGLSANIYREPDVTQHGPLLQLPWESRLQAVPDAANHNDRWLRVRLVDGQTGWVQRGDVAALTPPLSIDESLQLARRFLGVTYTWGGVSAFGFDCSGFTQMLVRQRGIEMPRDASVQAAWDGVIPVERKDLKPGDLLFFGSSASHITHTGMYLGDGEFIHDTTHGHPGVQVSRLDDMPWTRLFVAARRVKP